MPDDANAASVGFPSTSAFVNKCARGSYPHSRALGVTMASSPLSTCFLRHLLTWHVLFTFAVAFAGSGATAVLTVTPLAELTAGAGKIVRGRCVARRVEEQHVGGLPVRVTVYRFEVREYLKGHGAAVFDFRQVGTPEGGPADLGRLVGLPVYVPGDEYVLFLLRESTAGLTSPAGAGEGAFLLREEQITALRGHAGALLPEHAKAGAAPALAVSVAYETFRAAILENVEP